MSESEGGEDDSTPGIRRPREDDDHDQERDRRHPSHRARESLADGEPPAALVLALLTRGPFLHLELAESPANAARIIAGLATVPEGLIRRLEHVNAMGKADETAEDNGCSICQDRLIDDSADCVAASLRPSSVATSPEALAPVTVVVLPCTHLFHVACISPWFAKPRQTTCPLCRFDLDPKGIIWSDHRQAVRLRDHGEEAGEEEDGLEFEIMISRRNATLSPRAVILLLALLLSDVDPILLPPNSPHPGLGAHRGQSDTSHGAAYEQHAGFFLFPSDTLQSASRVGDEGPLLQEDWEPPPPPGPTLRDRVERCEREVGLRCCATLCYVGPSDEDPFVGVSETARPFVQRLSIGGDERGTETCTHMYHPECLVSAQRAEEEVMCALCST